MFYGLVNSEGYHYQTIQKMLTLKEMQNLVGKTGDSAYIEVVYNQFTDQDIVLVCDEEFLLKHYQPTCKTQREIILHGNVLVLGFNRSSSDLSLLNASQMRLAESELTIVK